MSLFSLYFPSLCIPKVLNREPWRLWPKWNLYEHCVTSPIKMRMETGQLPLEERASKHSWEDLYLRHWSAQSAMATLLFRIWCTRQFAYTASCYLSFSKRLYFYPPNILPFTYPKEPCFFGSFPLAALVGNLSEHLSSIADLCVTDSI